MGGVGHPDPDPCNHHNGVVGKGLRRAGHATHSTTSVKNSLTFSKMIVIKRTDVTCSAVMARGGGVWHGLCEKLLVQWRWN